MAEAPDIAISYTLAQASFAEFARTLSDDDWAVPTPCTPEWTVRDVLSHVAGIPDDAFAGRMDGAPGEEWTAAQIERNRSFSVPELLERWDAQTPGFADMIQAIGESRPPFDCHTHEHDVRQALGRPGNRDSLIIEGAALGFAAIDDCPVPLTVELADGRIVHSGPADAERSVTLRGVTPFELFRSRPGRRSAAQVRAWDWTGDDADIDAIVAVWAFFGPTTTPIVE